MTEGTKVTAAGTVTHFIGATQSQTEKVIAACPEGRRLYQLGEGKATPLWLIGHLSNTTDFIGGTLGLGLEGIVPKEWREKFLPTSFGGNPITANAGDYPSWDEVVDLYGRVMTRYTEALAGLNDDDLAGPTKGEVPDALKEMLSTIQDTITLNLVHDGHHRGQLALLANAPG